MESTTITYLKLLNFREGKKGEPLAGDMAF